MTLENQLSLKRNNTFQDELLADEILRVLELNSVSQTLRLLGAPVEPIFDMHTGTLFLKNAFAFIVNCIQVYFEPC